MVSRRRGAGHDAAPLAMVGRRRASKLGAALLAIVAGLAHPAVAEPQSLPTSDACVACHARLEDARLAEPARSFALDVHAELGFGCLACHGGTGGERRLDPARGFLSAPPRRSVPEVCGRCHSDAAYMRQFDPGLRVDQVAEYWTSGHGTRLRASNDPDVATCTSCHPTHRIRPPDDPESSVHPSHIVETCGRCHADQAIMAGRASGTGQVDAYLGSVHGRLLTEEGDLSAPVCNDCHGNHGAAPPGLGSVRNVCGQCHSVMADYFDQSGHEDVFEAAGLPGCVTCHGNHAVAPVTDETLGERSESVCLGCHQAGDPAGRAFEDIARVLDSLVTAEERSRALLEEAEGLGMEVSQALFELEDVRNARTRAHSAIHTFRLEPVLTEVEAGFDVAGAAAARGREALDEHRFRRVGLGVSSLIILLLIVGLILKIRQLEGRTAPGEAGAHSPDEPRGHT
jgi:predicted CXXCH cytochrome family protein